MTNEELIHKFNPATAGNLTEGDLAIMRGLTSDQIAELAKAYPNNAHQRPYLLLADSTLAENKQLFPLSTWQNLHTLHKFHSRKNFSAYTFKVLFTPRRKAPSLPGVHSAVATGKVVDLSSGQAAELLRQNFGGNAAPANPIGTTSAKKVPQKPAATQNPKNSAKGKTVDLTDKTTIAKAAKGAAPVAQKQAEAEDEEMQDFE